MDQPKISYIHSQFRVRCEFSKGYCDSHPEPPSDLIGRAIRKLAFEMAIGNIDSYDFYEQRLRKVWHLYRESSDVIKDTLAVTLATGCPHLKGITVKPNLNDPLIVANISISADAKEIASWKPELFKYYVSKKLRGIRPDCFFDIAELYGLWYQASQGTPIKNHPVHKIEIKDQSIKHFRIRAIPELGIVALYCYNIRILQDKKQLQNLLAKLSEKAHKEFGAKNFLILKEDIVKKIRSSFRGVERFGIDMPVVIVGAVKQHRSKRIAKIMRERPQEEAIDTKDVFRNNFFQYLNLAASSDRLVATLSLDQKVYIDFPGIKVSWLKELLKDKGYRVDDGKLARIQTYIDEHKPVQNFVFSEGKLPQNSDEPYLNSLLSVEIPEEDGRVDFRKFNPNSIVRKGEVIADIRFQVPAIDGYDIYGKSIPAKKLMTLNIDLPEGVEQKDDGVFIATQDGIPTIEGQTISFMPTLVHQGSVNFSTGDISFDGPVLITGDVEGRASVNVTGDVVIKGSVTDGHLLIQGNLLVEQGIRGGSSGSVKVNGNLSASFLENARVEVTGNISLKKGIIGGAVICGEILKVSQPESKVYGCQLYINKKLECHNLGKESAKRTDIYLGIDYPTSQKIIEIHRKKTKFSQILAETEEENEKLTKLNPAPSGISHKKDRERAIAKRISKLNSILKRLTHRQRKLTKLVEQNLDSDCQVKRLLEKNSYFHFGVKTIATPIAMTGVTVRYREGLQSPQNYFVPIQNPNKSA